MEVEVSAEAKDKRLNRFVAITVVVLSVFMGLCNIKDGNLVQAMQQAQSNGFDRWNEYQATKTKLHIAETARMQLAAQPVRVGEGTSSDPLIELDADVKKYESEVPGLAMQAKGYFGQYDTLNVHDDQFDASDALISTAISLAAVSALIENFWVLAGSWAFGAFGIFLGVCGFAKWGFHPDVLSNFLG